jgi:hypothetical protein
VLSAGLPDFLGGKEFEDSNFPCGSEDETS